MPLRTKFLILSGLVQAFLVTLLIWNNLRLLDDAITKNAYRLAHEYAVTLNFSLTPYSSSGRLPELQSYLEEMLSDPNDSVARYLLIVDAAGRPIIKVGEIPLATLFHAGGMPAEQARNGLKMTFAESIVHVSAPLLLTEHKVGLIYFGLSTQDLALTRSEVLRQGSLISIAGFIVAQLFFYVFTLGIGRRLQALTGQSTRLAQGEFGDVLPERGGDEIEIFTRSLNAMSVTLRERIDQLNNSERRLAESEARFKTLFELAPVPLSVTDRAGVLLDINVAMTRIFGRERDAVLGKTTEDINFWGSSEERNRIWQLYERNGALHGEIAVAPMPDGRVLELSIWSTSFSVDGAEFIIWVMLDLTEESHAKRALTELNASLENRVRLRSSELEHANSDLTATLETLKQTQNDLIRAEKLASLGSLVAGIAHELNTPIGNSLLIATTLSDKVSDQAHLFGDGAIKRSALTALLSDTKVACTLMTDSLHRAANLIASFKQVAVDQTTDRRRIFDLRTVLHDTLATYARRLRLANCEAELDAPDGLGLDSYPGSFGQVIENLTNNALIHAFSGRSSASIRIVAREAVNDSVEVVFSDDGIGMPAEVLHQIFDPFFTTKMGHGGSGLGMNIVYNIVTGILGGRIVVESEPGRGTSVKIVIPKQAPRHKLPDTPMLPIPLG